MPLSKRSFNYWFKYYWWAIPLGAAVGGLIGWQTVQGTAGVVGGSVVGGGAGALLISQGDDLYPDK
jgi:hypothetical protein